MLTRRAFYTWRIARLVIASGIVILIDSVRRRYLPSIPSDVLVWATIIFLTWAFFRSGWKYDDYARSAEKRSPSPDRNATGSGPQGSPSN